MREDEKLVCVCCPTCGTLIQKSITTRSCLVCDDCHTHFWAVADDGFVTVFELENRGKKSPSLERMRHYRDMLVTV